MKTFPWVASLLLLGAVALMIGLGVWQLTRAQEKRDLIAQYAKADVLPAMAYPANGGDERLWFRKASGFCLEPAASRVEPGRTRTGQIGWRHITSCRTGAEGPGMTVDIGTSTDFKIKPQWRGGSVTGVIASQPDHRSLIAKILGLGSAPGVMLVADTAAQGLVPSAAPSLADVPNNHLAYAVQWFIFAGLAVLIFGLALRRRR
jgi:surfeit locus 1 family protein